jgi:hypothetical protein
MISFHQHNHQCNCFDAIALASFLVTTNCIPYTVYGSSSRVRLPASRKHIETSSSPIPLITNAPSASICIAEQKLRGCEKPVVFRKRDSTGGATGVSLRRREEDIRNAEGWTPAHEARGEFCSFAQIHFERPITFSKGPRCFRRLRFNVRSRYRLRSIQRLADY